MSEQAPHSNFVSALGNRISRPNDGLRDRLDLLGTALSVGCAIHCMALPLIVSLLPLLGLSFIGHRTFDIVMFSITILIASASLCWGTRIHKNFGVLFLLLAAVVFFALGGFHAHDLADGLLVGTGGFCLATAHLINRKLCKSCDHCSSHQPVA